MQIRDRIIELRRVRANELKPNPRNWRTHPEAQRHALRGLLADVGYADALLARELPDGQLELIDGHLRAETTPEVTVPVLVLDVNADEADKILLTLDPLSALASVDQQRLGNLLESCEFEHPAVEEMLTQLAQEVDGSDQFLDQAHDRPEVDIPASFQVVVECENEQQQEQLYERMRKEGYTCRVLTL